jgi:hypothetical protein
MFHLLSLLIYKSNFKYKKRKEKMNIRSTYFQNIISGFSVKRESTGEKDVDFENLICYILSGLFCHQHPQKLHRHYADITSESKR